MRGKKEFDKCTLEFWRHFVAFMIKAVHPASTSKYQLPGPDSKKSQLLVCAFKLSSRFCLFQSFSRGCIYLARSRLPDGINDRVPLLVSTYSLGSSLQKKRIWRGSSEQVPLLFTAIEIWPKGIIIADHRLKRFNKSVRLEGKVGFLLFGRIICPKSSGFW